MIAVDGSPQPGRAQRRVRFMWGKRTDVVAPTGGPAPGHGLPGEPRRDPARPGWGEAFVSHVGRSMTLHEPPTPRHAPGTPRTSPPAGSPGVRAELAVGDDRPVRPGR